MKKILIPIAALMLASAFTMQNVLASEMSMSETCRAEAADAGIEDRDELENYVAECMDMMQQSQGSDASDENQEWENQDESDFSRD